jgi:hypothetical protein
MTFSILWQAYRPQMQDYLTRAPGPHGRTQLWSAWR